MTDQQTSKEQRMESELIAKGLQWRNAEGTNAFAGDLVILLQQKLQLSCQDEGYVGWIWRTLVASMRR